MVVGWVGVAMEEAGSGVVGSEEKVRVEKGLAEVDLVGMAREAAGLGATGWAGRVRAEEGSEVVG